MSKSLEEIKEDVNIEFQTEAEEWLWSNSEVNEVAKRYAKEQNTELVEMLELMCMDIEELGKGRGVAYRMAKKLLTKYK